MTVESKWTCDVCGQVEVNQVAKQPRGWGWRKILGVLYHLCRDCIGGKLKIVRG